jgi:hypothetical protein
MHAVGRCSIHAKPILGHFGYAQRIVKG